ncbi:hypothetical protein ZIOFF_005724 [Zingiber officinale]|uniref:Uncharacterized protein n=1 Tax=Zingiber officinale TaxID=94328 RepID=A0A8J5ID00_ZINOF|nr:hypothetical protein ZIOFF_005724 [Zingiber officinale]
MVILFFRLSEIQWAAFILLCAGCTTAQLNSNSDQVLQTPIQGWVGDGHCYGASKWLCWGVHRGIFCLTSCAMLAYDPIKCEPLCYGYGIAIIKKRPSRNINVQNFWLYIFGMVFNLIAIWVQDYDEVMSKGFFNGYSFITVCMILNHALSGIAVSMVMKYADNIVKVYSTSVAMLLTAIVSVFLFRFHLSLAFFLGSTVVSVSVYLHSIGKLQLQK